MAKNTDKENVPPVEETKQETITETSGNMDAATTADQNTEGNPNEVRIGRIKEMAKDYETLKPEEKVKLLKFIKADIASDRDKLANDLASLNALLEERGIDAPAKEAKASEQNAEGKLTNVDAVKKALANGKLKIDAIVDKVAELKGEKVEKTTINQALAQLKKKGVIESKTRGEYSLK